MRSNSKTIGDIAELKAAAYYTENGYYVSKPLGENTPYDLIIDDGQTLSKVQVKSRKLKPHGVISINGYYKTSGGNITPFNKTHFDELFIYNPDMKRACILNWEDLTKLQSTCKNTIILRLLPTKNNQIKDVNFFKDYEIEL